MFFVIVAGGYSNNYQTRILLRQVQPKQSQGSQMMRKRFLLISTIIVLSAFTFAACGKKSPSSPESTNSETTTAEPTTVEPTTDIPTTAKSTTIEPTTAKPTEPETSKDDGESNSNGGGRCYFNGFSIEVPEDYTYEVDGDKVTFYESYNHEHSETGSDGFLFAIDWTYDGTVSIDSRRLGSKDGKYFMYIHPTGFGMLEDEYANQRMVDARAETDDVLSSFRVE